MASFTNPALEAFVSCLGNQLVFAQVLIRRAGSGYELRHVADRDAPADNLRLAELAGLRAMAQFAAHGAFRPLKSAPDLQSGWRCVVESSAELGWALSQLYPGAIGDWYAARIGSPPVTHYREFAWRQTGMYRITTLLDDGQVRHVTNACCHKRFCLKRRLWTGGGLAPDPEAGKSLIPCLEPCAILLEFARKAVRVQQEERIQVEFSSGEFASIRAALEIALGSPDGGLRDADFDAPANHRRLQLLVEKLAGLAKPLTVKAEQ